MEKKQEKQASREIDRLKKMVAEQKEAIEKLKVDNLSPIGVMMENPEQKK